MGKLLCEKNVRDVWCRNESVRAEIGQILQTHRQTHASKLVVEILCHFIDMLYWHNDNDTDIWCDHKFGKTFKVYKLQISASSFAEIRSG